MIRTQIFSFLMAITFMSFGLMFTAQATESKTVTLDVPGMTCSVCPVTIRKALEKTPGVIEAKADFDSKTATVTFDPFETNVELLTQATANVGYPSTLKQ